MEEKAPCVRRCRFWRSFNRHLAVAHLAKGARVLPRDTHRVAAFLAKAGVIQEQLRVALGLELEQALDSLAVKISFLPGQIGQQIVQPLRMRYRDHARQGFAILIRVLVEQPGDIALQVLGALALAKLHTKKGRGIPRRGWPVSSSWHEMLGWSRRTLIDQRRPSWWPDVTIRVPSASSLTGFMMMQLAPRARKGCAGQADSGVRHAELQQNLGGRLGVA